MVKLVLATFLVISLAGCGAEPQSDGQIESVSQAINEGQICAPSTYNPLSPAHGWPEHGWCRWMPGWPHGLNSPGCGSGPPPEFTVYAYSGPNATGSCTRWTGYPLSSIPFKWMAENGWNTVLNGVPTSIKSAWVGSHTQFTVYDGPTFSSEDAGISVIQNGGTGTFIIGVRGYWMEVASAQATTWFGESNF